MKIKNPLPLLQITAVLSFAFAASSHAALTITTNTGTNGISGLVKNDVPGTGSFPSTLNVKNTLETVPTNPETTRKIYIRFDVSSLNFTATTATLSLEAHIFNLGSGETRTISVWSLNDGANDSWNSATMDWDDAVANDTSSGSAFTNAATLLGSFILDENDAAGDTFNFSNNALRDFINSDTNNLVTIMLSAELSGNATTNGRNTVFAGDATSDGVGGFRMAPTLTLIPEPSTALLGGLGTLLLLLRRRRA